MLDLNNVWLGRRDGWLGPMAPALSATVFNLASEAAAPALCCTPWRPGHLPGRRVLPTVVSVAAAGVAPPHLSGRQTSRAGPTESAIAMTRITVKLVVRLGPSHGVEVAETPAVVACRLTRPAERAPGDPAGGRGSGPSTPPASPRLTGCQVGG